MQRRPWLLGAVAALAAGAWPSRAGLHPQGLHPQGLHLKGLRSPQPLRAGSRLLAVAPGTWVDEDRRSIERLRQRCRTQGWELVTPPQLFGRWRWFSASDPQRTMALQSAWEDESADALICVSGGWGAARLLLNGLTIPARPRWLIGFSDCSALLLAQLARGSGGGIHGWWGGDSLQWQRLADLLQGRPVTPLKGRGRQGGVAVGSLVVCNLTVATSLIGTAWLPSLAGCILVLEDTGEAPYRIDRQLSQWLMAGLLVGVRGIGLGRFTWAEDDILTGDFSMDEILLERLRPLGVPLVSHLPVGHGNPNLALPMGALACLDGDRGLLSLSSAAPMTTP